MCGDAARLKLTRIERTMTFKSTTRESPLDIKQTYDFFTGLFASIYQDSLQNLTDLEVNYSEIDLEILNQMG